MANDSSNLDDTQGPLPKSSIRPESAKLFFVEKGADHGDTQDRVFWTLDLSSQEFANKVIATDRDATEVLAVADSLEQLAEMLSASEFRRMLLQRFGDESAYLIHSGPIDKTSSDRPKCDHGEKGPTWEERESERARKAVDRPKG